MWTDNKHENYHLLLENLPDAFAYHQIITDKHCYGRFKWFKAAQ